MQTGALLEQALKITGIASGTLLATWEKRRQPEVSPPSARAAALLLCGYRLPASICRFLAFATRGMRWVAACEKVVGDRFRS